MVKNPDPALKLTTTNGVTRTLDDWSTIFQLSLVILPGRPEAGVFLPIAQRIFETFGDADCTTAFVVTGTEAVAERVLGAVGAKTVAFIDPDLELVTSLGLERLPALVHLRQDTAVVAAAEGWSSDTWQQVVRQMAKSMAWTTPTVARPGDPPAFAGWPIR
jgi:hypothetical protein